MDVWLEGKLFYVTRLTEESVRNWLSLFKSINLPTIFSCDTVDEPKALHMLDKHSTRFTTSAPQPRPLTVFGSGFSR